MLEKQESYSQNRSPRNRETYNLVKTTTVLDDGEVLSQSHHRSVVTPLDDISDLPDNVQAVCNAFWTDELIANFQNQQNELEN
jgi:predicted metal-dependent HD superfamily phosphohydrolase